MVADVPQETERLIVVPYMRGTGTVWLDDLQISVVGDDVPVTDSTVWHRWSLIPGNYTCAVDPNALHDGHPTFSISSTTARKNQWAAYDIYDRHPEQYQGHVFRLTAWMKSENVSTDAGIWIRVLGPGDAYITGEVAPARRQIHGTSDWQQYTIEVPIPPEAMAIGWGFVMDGKGTLWMDLDEVECQVIK
jgi:hypothetical protein